MSDDTEDEDTSDLLYSALLSRLFRGARAADESEPSREVSSNPFQLCAEEVAQRQAMPASSYNESLRAARCSRPPAVNAMKVLTDRALGIRTPWCCVASAFLPSKPVARIFPSTSQRLYTGQYSRSGALFVSAGQDDSVVLYDSASWRPVKSIAARDVQWTVTSTDMSPDERFLTYTTLSPVMHLCNVSGDYELHESLSLSDGRRGTGFAVWCAKFSAGGGELVCGCGNERVMVYDIERKRVVGSCEAHKDDINSVCFADANYQPHVVVSASDDTFIKVWDRREMRSTESAPRPAGVLPGHLEGITHVTSKGDGVYLLSNSKDQTAKLWDLRRLAPSTDRWSRSQYHPRGGRWDYRFMDFPRWGAPVPHPGDVSVMTYRGHTVLRTLIRCYFSPAASTAQSLIVTGSATGSVVMYNALTGEVVRRLQGHRGVVRDVSWHPYKQQLVSSSWDGTAVLWQPGEQEDSVAAPASDSDDGYSS